MRHELLIAAGPGEWRAALLEDGVPAELFVERGDRSETGSIHLGRVSRLVPGLSAALVDIGEQYVPSQDPIVRIPHRQSASLFPKRKGDDDKKIPPAKAAEIITVINQIRATLGCS